MTLSFELAYDPAGCILTLEQPRQGLLAALRRRPQADLNYIPREDREVAIALARVRALDRDGREHSIDANTLKLSHSIVASLDSFSATALGLPPLVKGYVFKSAMRGTLGSRDFKLDWWWERGGQIRPLRRVGAIIDDGQGPMRLPIQLFRAIEVSQAFDATRPLSDHWLALGEFRRALGIEETDAPVVLEGALQNIEIITSDRIGLQVDDEDDTSFEAVPFVGAKLSADAQPGTDEAPIRGQELLEFQKQVRERGAHPAYRLAPGKFLILDRTAMPVVQVISNAAKGDAEQRRAFIKDAERIISDAIEEQARADGNLNELMSPEAYAEALERAIGQAWTETKEWASRVIGIAEWKRLALDQLSGSGTNWLPQSMTKELGELLGKVRDDEVETLLGELKQAVADRKLEIAHRVGTIPVTPDVIEALMRRLEMIKGRKAPEPPSEPKPVFLPVTHSNFWDNDFKAKTEKRAHHGTATLPTSVTRTLKPHQVKAFEWQVDAWRFGLPGILNADEQGLGKTLQTLAYLTWLAERMLEGAPVLRPVLIVAPTSLLRNWEAELTAHISENVWGAPVRLYGSHLAKWKTSGLRGRDTEDGVARLDLSALSSDGRPKLVITTYQTLANYAVSFSENEFSVAVFDEIQNLKNPATMRAEAARAVDADFRIGLTGTPVENSTRDIWAIMDQLFPGALGPMAEFRRIFDVPEERRMRQLHGAIFSSIEGKPALGLRRLKKDAASELPPKVRVLHPRIMPEVQAIRYDEVRAKGGAMFALLHHIRRTSLHPGLINGEDPKGFTVSSARVAATLEILADIKSRGERALVFVENRDVQAWFAELIKIEFGLDRVFVINGDTGIDARKEIVDRFQRHLAQDGGFDVLVMGPRAAGTGLTLTAANHVIHLTRWWNPAVEEQCNDRTHRIGQARPVTVHIPLAVHPRLGPSSFDCLLQRLMKRKRGIADAVLWPQESEEAELLTLYESVIAPGETDERKDEEFVLEGREDLEVEQLSPTILRVRPKSGGSSILVAQASSVDEVSGRAVRDDAAVIVMGAGEGASNAGQKPTSLLPDTRLWPEYVLPE